MALASFGSAQRLSQQSSVSLLTCGSGADLYSIFGHTGIRVKDTVQGFDIVFNYGTFSFSEDFYVKFVMGKLNYKLSIEDYEGFEKGYRWENRWVYEQVLNLNYEERQQLFDFLNTNYLPENREYLYDFFYDNCSTRPRDAIEEVLGDQLIYHYNEPEEDSTFKDMLDVYLTTMQWPDAGMDLGLGQPADKILTEREKTFLPDYLLRAYDKASIKRNGVEVPLVKKKELIVPSLPLAHEFNYTQPSIVMWCVLVLWLCLFLYPKTRGVLPYLDTLLFTVIGLAGWLIVFLWFITDHTTTQLNVDALWASPLFFPLGWLALKKNKSNMVRKFFAVLAVCCAITLVIWPFTPQNLNEVYIPIILLLLWRCYAYSLPINEAKVELEAA